MLSNPTEIINLPTKGFWQKVDLWGVGGVELDDGGFSNFNKKLLDFLSRWNLFDRVLKLLKDKSPKWQDLSILGKSKFIQSFSIWIVVVPIIAKILNQVPESISIGKILIEVNLPFNLKIFYICSLLFSIANFLYLFRCPEMIKKYKNYNEFYEAGQSPHSFNYFYKKIKNTQGRVYEYKADRDDGKQFNHTKLAIFNQYYSKFNYERSCARIFISVLYLLSGILLAVLLFQNTYFVLFDRM